jgi:hypothetical protein
MHNLHPGPSSWCIPGYPGYTPTSVLDKPGSRVPTLGAHLGLISYTPTSACAEWVLRALEPQEALDGRIPSSQHPPECSKRALEWCSKRVHSPDSSTCIRTPKMPVLHNNEPITVFRIPVFDPFLEALLSSPESIPESIRASGSLSACTEHVMYLSGTPPEPCSERCY